MGHWTKYGHFHHYRCCCCFWVSQRNLARVSAWHDASAGYIWCANTHDLKCARERKLLFPLSLVGSTFTSPLLFQETKSKLFWKAYEAVPQIKVRCFQMVGFTLIADRYHLVIKHCEGDRFKVKINTIAGSRSVPNIFLNVIQRKCHYSAY